MNLQKVLVETAEIIMSKPFEQRSPNSCYDFGDEKTVGLYLKKENALQASYDKRVFGIFLGKLSDNKFYVGTMSAIEWHPADIESFDSLEELKRVWMLD